MTFNRHYTYFGLSKDANLAEIKQAYRRKAKSLHPDTSSVSQLDAEEEFKELQQMYLELISHKKELLKKKKNAKSTGDETTKRSSRSSFRRSSRGSAEQYDKKGKQYDGGRDIDSLFDVLAEMMFSDLRSIFSRNPRNRSTRTQGDHRGENVSDQRNSTNQRSVWSDPTSSRHSEEGPSVIDSTHHNHDSYTVCLECRRAFNS